MANHLGRIAATVMLLAAAPAVAQEGGLYPKPPSNAAFVRVINARSDGAPATAQLGTRAYKGIAPGSSSTYQVVKAGSVSATVGAATAPMPFQAGKFYTVAVMGAAGKERPVAIVDQIPESRAKALITLYNLTGKAGVSLKTPDGGTVVIPAVAAGKTGNRQVNAASSGFMVAGGDGKAIAAIPTQRIARNVAYSVIVTEAGGKPRANWIENKIQSN